MSQQVAIPIRELLELHRLYSDVEAAKEAFKKKAEDLCDRYGIESKVVVFTH